MPADTTAYQVSLSAEDDADGTDEDNIVEAATASSSHQLANSSEDRTTSTQDGRDRQQFTPFDDHRQRAGVDADLRQQPMVTAIDSDHSSFPVVQDRCGLNNDSREACQEMETPGLRKADCQS